MAAKGKHARGNHAASASQSTQSFSTQPNHYGQGQQANQQMSRDEYERAFRDAFGDPRTASSVQGDIRETNQGFSFGATQIMPQQAEEPSDYQRMATAASPYQRYGEPTANSWQYDKWANQQQRADNKFDMNRGRKKIAVRHTFYLLLIILVGIAIGTALYFHYLDDIIDLGKQKNDVTSALVSSEAGQPYYVLLIGNDSREGVAGSDAEWADKAEDGSDGQSDVMILARVDENNDLVTMLSIPRDTPWQKDDGSWVKLKEYYRTDGPGKLIKAVSTLTGVPVSHYAEIHMSGFMNLVDGVGGIDVEVPFEIDYHEALTNQDIHLDAGMQHLNGAEAEVFARERTSYSNDQDMNRQGNVRTIVQALFNKIQSKPAWELPGVITACAQCVSTDMNSIDLAKVMAAIGKPRMFSGTGPYAGDINPYLDDEWFCYVDSEGWSRVMQVVASGGDPSSVSYEGDYVYPAGSQ